MFFFKNSAMSNNQKSFYDLEIESINGEIIKLKDYRDKVILIVNTASYCGFTKQYEDLQELWDKYKSKGLIVLGVPSDFMRFLSGQKIILANLQFLSGIFIKY